MISGTQFLWLIHGLLILGYFAAFAEFLYYKIKHPDVSKTIKDQGHNIFDLIGNLRDSTDMVKGSSIIFFGHNFAYALAINGVPILLMIISGLAIFFAMQSEVIKSVLKARGKQTHNNRAKADFERHYNAGSDTDFDYEESSFSAQESESKKSTPRGFEQRHSDDAKFWAMVDDPAASDGERKNAFSAILKKQAKRQGKAGRDKAATVN